MSKLLYFPLIISICITTSPFLSYSSDLIENEGWNPYMVSSFLFKESNSIPNYGIIIDDQIDLSNEDKISINETLKNIYNEYSFNGYFIIISSLNSDYNYNLSGMKLFCKELIDYITKYNSNINKNNIFILIYAINDEMYIFNTGKNVNKKLSDDERNLILTKQKSKIREEKYSEAFIKISNDILYYMNHCSDCVSFWVGIGFFVFIGIIIVILLIMYLIDCIKGRHISKNEKVKIYRIEKFLNEYKKDKNILDNICIICMKDINEEESISLNITNNNEIINDENREINEKKKIKTLSCNHQFHDKCYYEWVIRQDNTCPLCEEKLNKIDNYKDVYIKIISIQKYLHKHFNELEFDFINGKLNYKFTERLHKNDLTILN